MTIPKDKIREELKKDIIAILTEKCIGETLEQSAGVVADYMMEDRKRVVQPLVEATEEIMGKHPETGFSIFRSAIHETLINAGIDL